MMPPGQHHSPEIHSAQSSGKRVKRNQGEIDRQKSEIAELKGLISIVQALVSNHQCIAYTWPTDK